MRTLKPNATVIPHCECGDCEIRVNDANSNDYEVTYSGEETTMAFTAIEAETSSDCDVVSTRANVVGHSWVKK